LPRRREKMRRVSAPYLQGNIINLFLQFHPTRGTTTLVTVDSTLPVRTFVSNQGLDVDIEVGLQELELIMMN
jgi:hypothetical protein